MEIFLFFFYSLIITFSTIGYGLLVSRYLNFTFNNIGLYGILGLFFLSVIASYTHLVLSHNYLHNFITLFCGLLCLWIFNKKILNDLKYLVILFCLLYVFLIISKTNEDFGYYHLPNSIQFAQQKLQFGLGNLNHGFKHISSLFQLMSLNYLPFVKFYLFNLTNFLFFIFFLIFALKEIFKNSSKNLNISNILLSLLFILFLTKFSRLAEYGSDISGQIVVSIYFFYLHELIFNSKFNSIKKIEFLKISFILVIFAITLKFILVIYSLLLFLSLLLIKEKKYIFSKVINLNFLIICISSIVIFLFLNFTSTGCFIYPVEKLCFSNNFDWALDTQTINYLNFHYELWSKGGRGPSFIVTNPENYIQSFSWVSNWISVYFIGKFTDFLLVIFVIIIIFSLFFSKEVFKIDSNLKKFDRKYFFYFLALTIIFFIWFINFPTLRYAGFIVTFLMIIFPFSVMIGKKINLSLKQNLKKLFVLFLLSYSIFLFKNITRISDELKLEEHSHHNFKNFPFFWVNQTFQEKISINNFILQKVKGKCWATPSTCVRSSDNLKIISRNGYIFYINKNKNEK
jgi:hypothetical protein